MDGMIFNIQKFCVNDGPGIRTAVFMKGCPLRCIWCHNPESQRTAAEIMFYADKCIACGRCAAVCPRGCHSFESGVHSFDRNECIACFACTGTGCDALERVGRKVTVDEVIGEVMKDKIFYDNSSGGITLTGGEPLYQFEFSLGILMRAKKTGLHTALETCGFASPEKIKEISKYTDLFLFDFKETNNELHKRFTGVENDAILENLALINDLGKQVVLRCPIIPGCNDRKEHFEKIAEVASRLEMIRCVELEPYHPLGEGKYLSLGMSGHKFESPSDADKEKWLSHICTLTDKKVKLA